MVLIKNLIEFKMKISIPTIAILLLVSSILNAQNFKNQGKENSDLEQLKGYTQTYYFSPGCEERAKNIAEFMENAAVYFETELEFTPKTTLFILAPQHWKKYATFPIYGMPHNIDYYRLAIASEDNPFWKSFLPSLENLPLALVERINNSYRKTDGSYSMQPFFDLLALHEMGHSYHEQAGLKMQRKWISELFVNIMLHTYVAEMQPELLPALETFPEMVIGAGSSEYRYTSLKDFEEKYDDTGQGMTAKNYGWYQSNLHHAAKQIYNAGGKMVLLKLWNALKKHQEDMDNEKLVEILKKEVHPSVANVYLNWNKSH